MKNTARKTLGLNAMLVSLTVGKPQMTKTDVRATGIAQTALHAKKDAGHFRKDLYPKHLMQPIKSVETAARSYMSTVAYKWDRGHNLLPNARFMVFAEEMAKFELQFEQCTTAFLQNWVNVLSHAEDTQGDMFDAGDYPDVSELRRRFRFVVDYKPVTDFADFRIKLRDEEEALLKQAVSNQMTEKVDNLMREPLERLHEVVSRLHQTAGKEERAVLNPRTGKTEVKPPIFRDTVCENIIHEINLLADFADIMPSGIVELAATTAAKIPSADILRNSQAVREKTVENTTGLLSAIDALLGA